MANNSPANTPMECPKCKSPITAGMKFCESCGAKIEQTPACEQCGAPLLPNAKFCESCGKLVAVQPVPPVSAVPGTPAPAEASASPAAKTPDAVSVGIKKPAPAPEPAAPATVKAPDTKSQEKPKDSVPKIPGKAPESRTQTLLIAGVVGLVIIAALAYFVLLPMLAGTGTTSAGNSGIPSGASPTPTASAGGFPAQSAAPSSTASAQSSGSVSFSPEPTQTPPAELFVTYEAERDPITGLVTVTFRGGAGQNGVQDVSIRLSRSDGQIQTQTFKPQQIGSFTTLQGTRMTDRIEVIANYYNGQKYRIIDTLFEYKARN